MFSNLMKVQALSYILIVYLSIYFINDQLKKIAGMNRRNYLNQADKIKVKTQVKFMIKKRK